MSYTLSFTEEQGKPGTLTISGHLTIKNSFELHKQLLEYARVQKGLRLEVKEVEELDVAFLQLLLSLSKYHDEHQKPFTLHLDLNPYNKNLMQLAAMDKVLNSKHS